MTFVALLIGALLLLGLLALLALPPARTREQAPARQAPPPAPAANPLLRDATVVANSPERPGQTVGPAVRVSVVSGVPAQTLPLAAGQSATIGRHDGHALALRSHRVSRDHARLSVTLDGSVHISDLGSTNGTFLGPRRRRLSPQASERLKPGDSFWIGPEIQLVLHIAQDMPEPRAEG